VALVDQTDGGASDPRNRSIYFAFDSYTVESRYMPLVQRHARVMLAHPTRQIVIEGNTDSRGSREYNLALGQKRSEAVKQRMQLLGVPASRIEAVSFGREKPMALGENEEAWAKNRRADITYR
jgi:peptidoglycan-associated lipoprotein